MNTKIMGTAKTLLAGMSINELESINSFVNTSISRKINELAATPKFEVGSTCVVDNVLGELRGTITGFCDTNVIIQSDDGEEFVVAAFRVEVIS